MAVMMMPMDAVLEIHGGKRIGEQRRMCQQE
jgi:hypothetical protein